MSDVIVQTDPSQFQDKCDMIHILKAALKSGFKYECLRTLDGLSQPTDEFLIRVYNDEGDITARITLRQVRELGMEVLE